MQLALGRGDFGGALHDQRFKMPFVRLQLDQQFRQISQQQAEQQAEGGLERQSERVTPAFERRDAERPGAIGQVKGLHHRVDQCGGGGRGDALLLAGVRMNAPQFVAKAVFRQLG